MPEGKRHWLGKLDVVSLPPSARAMLSSLGADSHEGYRS
jgi:hypothetical protein